MKKIKRSLIAILCMTMLFSAFACYAAEPAFGDLVLETTTDVTDIASMAGQSLTLNHTIYNNAKKCGDTDARSAVVVTALYDGNSNLVDADYAPVDSITVDKATTTTIIDVPAEADGAYYSKSYLWTDFTDVTPYSMSTKFPDNNYIKDGGIEIIGGKTTNNKDHGQYWWRYAGKNGENFNFDDTNPHTGKYAMKLEGGCALNYAQPATFPTEAGKYRFTFWAKKGDAATGAVYPRTLLRYNNGSANVDKIVDTSKAIYNGNGWMKFTYEYEITEAEANNAAFKGTMLLVGFNTNDSSLATRILFIDDICLEKID